MAKYTASIVILTHDLTSCVRCSCSNFDKWYLNPSLSFSNSKVLNLNLTSASRGEPPVIQTEEKVIQEVVEAAVVILPEASAPKVSADPGPHPVPVPATPPKQASSQQAAPQTPASEGKRKPEPPTEVIEVPKALPAEHADQRRMLVEMCVRALFLCLSRFPQHYKSLYRLAFFYTNSKTHQVSPPLLTDGASLFSLHFKGQVIH